MRIANIDNRKLPYVPRILKQFIHLCYAKLIVPFIQQENRLNTKMGNTNEHQLIKDLKRALKNNELRLLYQPQFDSRTGKIRGFEALLRWHHPRLGLITPDQFIPIAEKTGLIVPIGEWVIKEACTRNISIQQNYLTNSIISINISTAQLIDPYFTTKIFTILQETNHPTNLLELEITETILIDQPHYIDVINELNNKGIKISTDDFGTGYSCLSYLSTLALDTIKLDRSFIKAIPDSEKNNIILQAIINLAHELQLYVIAEGVETYEQLHKLKRHGCDGIQGYLFSKPIPANELPALFNKVKKH